MVNLSEFEVEHLLDTDTVALRNVRCSGACRHRSAEECASTMHLVFPYRGVYIRHVASDQAVALAELHQADRTGQCQRAARRGARHDARRSALRSWRQPSWSCV